MTLKKEDLKIVFVTTPIRPVPTEYPPLGSLSVINALIKAGYSETKFYDIDGLRPEYEEILDYLTNIKPDVVAISAVVSTAYEYTKKLSKDIKSLFPETKIILGGNLGASAEILLKFTGVDFVVLGEGEVTTVAFMDCLRNSQIDLKKQLNDVPSLIFLDKNGDLVNTGYAAQIPKEEVYDIDWNILKCSSNISNFFIPVTDSILAQSTFRYDKRAYEKHRKLKNIGTLVASKGCVARCTFCHRWDKGIRYIPIPVLKKRIEEIVNDYNVGFITFGDENFGSDHRWLSEFCAMIKPFDVLWRVSGMRVNRIDPEHLEKMKDAGCSAVYFGMETGSKKIIEVMEKKVKIEDNFNAMQWIVESGLHTTIQLVLGMPGEDNSTIKETGKFVEFSARLSKDANPLDLSINYAQALPGTPLYEYARKKKLIGNSIEEEEKYLIMISDRDASDESTSLTFTDYPRLISETWRPYLIVSAARAYIKKFGRKNYNKQLLMSQYFTDFAPADPEKESEMVQDTGYFNFPKEQIDLRGTTDSTNESWSPVILKDGTIPSFLSMLLQKQWRAIFVTYPIHIYNFRFFLPMMVLFYSIFRQGIRYSLKLVIEYFLWKLKNIFRISKLHDNIDAKSLRKTVKSDLEIIHTDSEAMAPLRQGR